jgi:transposase-like protein
VAQAKRRRFTAEFKQRILAEVEQAKGSGGIGALLRRHGLYSSLVTTWRKEQESGALQALTPRKRGPKPTRDPLAEENQQLRRDIQQLTEDLRKADIVIDIQKKVAALDITPCAKFRRKGRGARRPEFRTLPGLRSRRDSRRFAG